MKQSAIVELETELATIDARRVKVVSALELLREIDARNGGNGGNGNGNHTTPPHAKKRPQKKTRIAKQAVQGGRGRKIDLDLVARVRDIAETRGLGFAVAETGVKYQTAYGWATKWKWNVVKAGRPARPPKGRGHLNLAMKTKYSKEQLNKARKMWVEGEDKAEIADFLGTKEETVKGLAGSRMWGKYGSATKSPPAGQVKASPHRRCEKCQCTTTKDPCHNCGAPWIQGNDK